MEGVARSATVETPTFACLGLTDREKNTSAWWLKWSPKVIREALQLKSAWLW